jgi:hypothetical protein
MIRPAVIRDLHAIRALPLQLGAADTGQLNAKKFHTLLDLPDYVALVHLLGNSPAGFLAMQFLPGRQTPGNFAVISHFAIERPGRDWQHAGTLEDHAAGIARSCRSAAMLSKGHARRPEITQFLLTRGYEPRDNHFVKNISYTR